MWNLLPLGVVTFLRGYFDNCIAVIYLLELHEQQSRLYNQAFCLPLEVEVDPLLCSWKVLGMSLTILVVDKVSW